MRDLAVDCFLADSPFLPIVVVIVFAWLVFYFNRQRNLKRYQMLEQLAQELGGRALAARFGGNPSLQFEAFGVPARLSFIGGGKNNPAYTLLSYDLPPSCSLEVRIVPEHFFHRIGKFFGMQDASSGDEFFDEKFLIKCGAAPEALSAMLKESTRQAIFQLRALYGNNHVEIVASRQRGGAFLQVKKLGWLDEIVILRRFISLAGEVLQGYLGAEGRPVEVLSRGRLSLCPTCGEAVDEPGRDCPACGKRHHRECWQLNDGCGACGFVEKS